MANAGPDTNGSQFFITLGPARRLDYLHSVFGRVEAGLEVLELVQPGDPFRVHIRRVGEAAVAFTADAEAFAALARDVPAPQPRHLDDNPALLPTSPPWARLLDQRLSNFARFTGKQIYVRLIDALPPDLSETSPAQLALDLARRTGEAHHVFALVYIAQTDRWGIWAGESIRAAFPNVDFTTPEGVAVWVSERQREAQALAPTNPTSAPPDASRALKLLLDEMLNAAMHALAPAP